MIQMKTVIIIDDSEMTREVMRYELQSSGYKVIGEAASGQEGIELTLELKPDIITLDHGLPDMTGINCLYEIQAGMQYPIVIAVGAPRSQETIDGLWYLGASGYVTKPFTADDLITTIDKAWY